MKNCPVGDKLLQSNRQPGRHADGEGWRFMTKLIVDFCNVANSPINTKAVSAGHYQTAVSFHRRLLTCLLTECEIAIPARPCVICRGYRVTETELSAVTFHLTSLGRPGQLEWDGWETQ
jgi:hypothetical protein